MLFLVCCFGGGKFTNPNHRQFECHYDHWKKMLEMARQNGWEPEGTRPNPEVPSEYPDRSTVTPSAHFKGDYEPVDWLYLKWISSKDAINLASALERALQGKVEIKSAPRSNIISEDSSVPLETHLMMLEGLSKEMVNTFIAFLKKGSFGIAFDD